MTNCKPGCDALGFGGHDFDCPLHAKPAKQVSAGVVPEWAMREFCKRANLIYGNVFDNPAGNALPLRFAVREGGRLIAAHEPAPDPLREAVEAAYRATWGKYTSNKDAIEALTAELRQRGVTAPEGGA